MQCVVPKEHVEDGRGDTASRCGGEDSVVPAEGLHDTATKAEDDDGSDNAVEWSLLVAVDGSTTEAEVMGHRVGQVGTEDDVVHRPHCHRVLAWEEDTMVAPQNSVDDEDDEALPSSVDINHALVDRQQHQPHTAGTSVGTDVLDMMEALHRR